jgi:leucyl aminopeptidase
MKTINFLRHLSGKCFGKSPNKSSGHRTGNFARPPYMWAFVLCSILVVRPGAAEVSIAPLPAPALAIPPARAVTPAPVLTPILSDIQLLHATGIPVLRSQASTGVGYAEISDAQQARLILKAHDWNRCGGFENLNASAEHSELLKSNHTALVDRAFLSLEKRQETDRHFQAHRAFTDITPRAEITAAVGEVSEANLKSTVDFLAAFHDRYNKGPQPNAAVEALKLRIEDMLKSSSLPYQIELITHQSTAQKTLHLRIAGQSRPQEIVVLGAHLDSINMSWMGDKIAPGADDNASGSANLIEALRILSTRARTERTLDFFWYAGEESGLLGSAEIAKDYKAKNADVVAVLQLDMTLHPGSGEFTLGSMNDFTSAWLRNYLESINSVYIKATIVNDNCGYGCSDHASWHRQGYPALMPFEATFNGMNKNLHTANDVINTMSSFKHSAIFTKIALVMAMDLGNSTLRETPLP